MPGVVPGGGDVVDVVRVEELVDDVEVPLVHDLLDHAAVDVLVRLDVLRRVLGRAARVAVLRALLGRLGRRRAGGDAELLHHRQHVELAPALRDQVVVVEREDVDAPDAHPAALRREAEHLARLLAGDLPRYAARSPSTSDELGRVVEVRNRAAEGLRAASVSAPGPVRPTSKKRVGGWSSKSEETASSAAAMFPLFQTSSYIVEDEVSDAVFVPSPSLLSSAPRGYGIGRPAHRASGRRPSCCSSSMSSRLTQPSIAMPSRVTHVFMPVISIGLPVAGMPK